MKNFLLSLKEGVAQADVPAPFLPHVKTLVQLGILLPKKDFYVLDASYTVGKMDVAFSGTGYLSSLEPSRSKDLIVEASGLHGAMRGDLVIAKRVTNKRGGRAKAVVVYIAQRAFAKSIFYTKMS